jgi:hypothetical protein
MPRVTNFDKNPAFPPAVEALKAEGVWAFYRGEYICVSASISTT